MPPKINLKNERGKKKALSFKKQDLTLIRKSGAQRFPIKNFVKATPAHRLIYKPIQYNTYDPVNQISISSSLLELIMEFPFKFNGIIDDIRKDYEKYMDALTAVQDEYESAGWQCTAENFKQEHKNIISTFNNVEKFICEITQQLVEPAPVKPADAEPREYLESDAQDGCGAHLTEECNTAAPPDLSDLNTPVPVECEAHHEYHAYL